MFDIQYIEGEFFIVLCNSFDSLISGCRSGLDDYYGDNWAVLHVKKTIISGHM